jgi:hypothetical protein
MPKAEFVKELKELGYDVNELDGDRVWFPYQIPTGRLSGQEIKLGFVVPGDFNLNPPSGPHVSPRLLPMNPTQGPHPARGIHESAQFGPEWQYWSRPLSHWAQTKRQVRDVMAHIRHLFDTL